MRSARRLAAALGLGLLIGVPPLPASALAEPGSRPQVAAKVDTAKTPGALSDTPTDKGPIGLLAIIATVCVVGVSVGAIRAIVGHRASRTEFA